MSMRNVIKSSELKCIFHRCKPLGTWSC